MTNPSELELARQVANDAKAAADALEGEARQARRWADSKMKHYEDLLLIHQGQMTLFEGD